MIKTLLLCASLLISGHAFAQFGYDVSTDKENGGQIFKGDFTFEDLKKEPSFTWLTTGTANYKPDSASVSFLKKHLGKFDLVIVMGTWCDDSHNLVPKLYKVMQSADYPMNKYKLYGVDRAKEAKGIEHKLYQIVNVPTIIVFKDKIEVGRIVETVKKSVEADLAKIIQKKLDEEAKD
jgi:thiol-disulfide isomerase/thioredoxin